MAPRIHPEAETEDELELEFPMWVVPISEMIRLCSSGEVLPPHEELRDAGRIVQHKPGMKTIFFSHTWLGHRHPDPSLDKTRLMGAILEGILGGKTKVTAYWMAWIMFSEKGISAKQLRRTFGKDDGYVWFDYASIPQHDGKSQGQAIRSITSYVALCDLFCVLAGPWKHVDDGSVRDVRAWGERGWCRMENLANSLSPKQKTFIVAQSPTDVASYGPCGMVGRFWFQETVGRGNFTVADDKLSLGPAILSLIERRQRQAMREGDIALYRFLYAATNHLLHGTGVSQPQQPLEAWLTAMKFSGVHDGEKDGLTPLRFAIVANRVDLVKELLDAGSDVHVRVRKEVPARFFEAGDTLLHTATFFAGMDEEEVGVQIVQLLLAAGATTRSVTRNPPHGNVLLNACVNSNLAMVDAIHKADPSLWQIPHFFGILPFEEAIMVGKPEMCKHALEHYAQELKGLPPGVPTFLAMDGRSGVKSAHTAELMAQTKGAMLVWYAVNHIGDTRVLQMVLDAGHDPNGMAKGGYKGFASVPAKLPIRMGVPIMTFLSNHMSNPPSIADRFANFFGSPLHIAALTGNLRAVEMLLEYGADPTCEMHKRKLTPLHNAAMKGHASCVDALLRHAPAGVNLAARKDYLGRTPDRWAAKRGYTELAARLKRLAAGGGTNSAPQSAVATSSAADKYRPVDEAEGSDAPAKALA